MGIAVAALAGSQQADELLHLAAWACEINDAKMAEISKANLNSVLWPSGRSPLQSLFPCEC
jgi:hypothetical protein